MNGYILSLKHDDESQIKYWAENNMTQNINDASFIPDVVNARRSAAALQNQFLDHAVTVLPAFKGVQLRNVVSTTIS